MHVIVVGEGDTEETFAGRVLKPHLAAHGIRVEPRQIRTSQQGRGGSLSRDRVVRALAYINDGPDTHPSARLTTLLQPRYKKPLHGSRIAASIGLARIREECRHFDAWLSKIESLQPL
jgi:hypothetical protein